MNPMEKIENLTEEVEKLKMANEALMQTVKLQQAINEKIIASLREIRQHVGMPL
jgi:predicted RNase H-like nuclease (RuvC/YqgF family)